MKKVLIVIIAISFLWQTGIAQEKIEGVRGDPKAIAEAEAMVETMGGMAIWAKFTTGCGHTARSTNIGISLTVSFPMLPRKHWLMRWNEPHTAFTGSPGLLPSGTPTMRFGLGKETFREAAG